MNLAQLSFGQVGRIESISGPAELVERLHEMGLHSGLEISLLQKTPFRGPMIFTVCNTQIALRFREAECIQIQTSK